MNNKLSFERRTSEEIFEWLKVKASELSEGRWTDFTAGDIGSVLLGLMSYLADINNFQIDKTVSELFLDTAVERSSIMSILKLIGYQPRHYLSASTTLTFTADEGVNNVIIPKYSTFTNDQGTITYTLLESAFIYSGKGEAKAMEGTRVVTNYGYSQISNDGKLFLEDYKLGINTVELFISGVTSGEESILRVDDVRYSAGDFAFSVHVNEYGQVYVQLPTYWTDLITEQSQISISYLLTSGEAGRVGANIITKPSSNLSLSNTYVITNPEASTGGYFPETADELRLNAPKHARTMDTLVTKKDLKDLVYSLPIIADIKAGDYNDPWTNYVQPEEPYGTDVNDAYKCKVLATPFNVEETSLYEDLYEWVLKKRLQDGETYEGSDGTFITYSVDPSTLNEELYMIDDSFKDEEGLRDIYEYEVVVENSPTSTLKQLRELINSRRVAGLYMEYVDPSRIVPDIEIKIYMDKNDLRKQTIASSVKEFMKQIYNRTYCKIGRSLHYSVIGRDIHTAFPQIEYVEITNPIEIIKAEEDEYIDMIYARFKIYVNDELIVEEF